MNKIGLDLPVTFRLNITTSNDWRVINLDQALDFIATSPKLQAIWSRMHDNFIQLDGLATSEDQEVPDDCLITPLQLHSPYKEAFRQQKLRLPCINFFGAFHAPSSAPQLQGEGNGVVVVDIDLKEFAREGALPADFVEAVEARLFNFFYEHPSTLFLYQSASTLGYHLGFLTGASNAEEYKRTFKALLQEVGEKVPILSKGSVLDPSASNYNRAFFVSYSPVVLRKTPSVVYAVPEAVEPSGEETQPQAALVGQQDQGTYSEFPYTEDFRLFLAFERRKEGDHFHDFGDWITLVFSLLNVYGLTYKDRLLYWFERLSQLSPKYNQENNLRILESVLDRGVVNRRAGVEFLIFRLNGSEAVCSRPHYSARDVEEYFESLQDADQPNQEYSDFFYIQRYLTERKEDLNLRSSLVIQSPPNSGKSTLILEHVNFKRIFLVPTLILLKDLEKKVPQDKLQVVSQEVQKEDIDPAKEVILSTYEGLEKILSAGLPLKDYTLVMDEAHNLFTASAPFFRFKTMHRVVRSLSLFHNFVMLSGTWIPFPFTNLAFTLIQVRLQDPTPTGLELVHTPTPLDTLTKEVVEERGKQVVLINNRTENRRLKEDVLLQHPDAQVTIVNRDTKESDGVSDLMNLNTLKEGEILVGTQMIAEGISLLDRNIAAIRFYRLMIPELIAQFSFRVRAQGAKPTISFYYAQDQFILTGLDYERVRQSLFKKFQGQNLSEMGREFIDPKQGLMIHYQQDHRNKKVVKNYSAQVKERGREQLDPLLLGYFTLQRAAQLMNIDLFSVLAALRKWGFAFDFSAQQGSMLRKHFKDLRLAQHLEVIKTDLATLLDSRYTREHFLPGTPLLKAWVALKAVSLEYFLEMGEQRRVDLFTSKKSYQQFLELVAGSTLVEDQVHSQVWEHLSKDFKAKDARVLSRVATVKGYPAKIFHQDLEDHFKDLGLSIQAIKKILSKQFAVSKPKTGSSQKYFGLKRKGHDFEGYLNREYLSSYSANPFL